MAVLAPLINECLAMLLAPCLVPHEGIDLLVVTGPPLTALGRPAHELFVIYPPDIVRWSPGQL